MYPHNKVHRGKVWSSGRPEILFDPTNLGAGELVSIGQLINVSQRRSLLISTELNFKTRIISMCSTFLMIVFHNSGILSRRLCGIFLCKYFLWTYLKISLCHACSFQGTEAVSTFMSYLRTQFNIIM